MRFFLPRRLSPAQTKSESKVGTRRREGGREGRREGAWTYLDEAVHALLVQH